MLHIYVNLCDWHKFLIKNSPLKYLLFHNMFDSILENNTTFSYRN